jgi:hypothetical protein
VGNRKKQNDLVCALIEQRDSSKRSDRSANGFRDSQR